jgi:nucleotide-binding universal stress UspA family protein
MTAHVTPRGDSSAVAADLDQYDRQLMTAVVNRAEKAGKHVQPLIVRTNNPLFAVIQTAHELRAQELILGASNIYTADEQIGQIALYWINLHGGEPAPLTVRILSRHRDLTFDLAGGSRIPKIGERRARSAAELRAAGVGVSHVLLAHYDTAQSSDLFAAVLTMLYPDVALSVVRIPDKNRPSGASDFLQHDLHQAQQLRREVEVCALPAGDPAQQIVELARAHDCDLIVLGMLEEPSPGEEPLVDALAVIHAAECPVCLVSTPVIPDEVDK